jgi:hypothetical protein
MVISSSHLKIKKVAFNNERVIWRTFSWWTETLWLGTFDVCITEQFHLFTFIQRLEEFISMFANS